MANRFEGVPSQGRRPSPEMTTRKPEHSELNYNHNSISLKPPWRSLFRFTAAAHIPALIIALLCTFAAGVIRVIFALYLGKLFQILSEFGTGASTGNQLLEQARSKTFVLLILGGLAWLLTFCFLFSWVVFAELQVGRAGKMLFEKLLKQDLVGFDVKKGGVGAFLSHSQKQLRELQIATAQPLGLFLLHTVCILSATILAFSISWKVTLVTLAGIPVSFVVISFTSARMAPIIKAQQSELSEASKLAYDAFKSIDVVKCLNGQASTYASMNARSRAASRLYMKLAILISIQMAIPRFMSFVMFVQGFWYGSTLVQKGELSPGDVLTTFWGCLILTQSISQIVHQSTALARGKVAGDTLYRYAQVPDTEAPCVRIQRNRYPDLQTEDIVLKDVAFAYPSRLHRPVLESINITFSASKTTFIVGRSGAGKSTLISLLLQFYSPTSGGILVGDTPFQAIETSWVRHNVTFVQQNSYLFNETLWDNIAFGCRHPQNVSIEQMEVCTELANLQATIAHLPNGLDTIVGLGGDLLSGGQRQRVAIARARMKNSAVLIVDEFTSALDNDNRSMIMKAVRKWREGLTTIIVTHDTSNILDDDFVYILEAGRVAASGLKKDLVEGDQRAVFVEATASYYSNGKSLQEDSIDLKMSSGQPCFSSDTCSETLFASFESSEDKAELSSTSIGDKLALEVVCTKDNTIIPSSQTPLVAKTPPVAQQKPKAVHHQFIGQEDGELNSLESKAQHSAMSTAQRLLPRQQLLEKRSEQSISSEKSEKNLIKALPVYKTLLTLPSILNLRQKFFLAIGTLIATFHSASTPIFSYLLSQLFDSFYTTDQVQASSVARKYSITIVGLAVVDTIMTFFMHYIFEYCSQAWMDELRSRSMQRMLAQPCSWFECKDHSPLQLTMCLDQRAEEIRNLAGRFGNLVLVVFLTAVIAIVWSFNLKWQLTLVSLACAPVWYGISKGLEMVNKKWERRTNDLNEGLANVFSEAFTDVHTVRAFTLESHFCKKLSVLQRRRLTVSFKRGFYSGIFYGLAESVIIFASAILIYYAAVLAAPNTAGISSLVSVLTMILFSLGYAVSVMSWIPQVNSANDTATRLIKLSKLPLGSYSHEDSGKLRVFDPLPIEFTNLNFRYPSRPETPVLRDFSLKISANTCSAIVGSSGSGKSTIVSLLLGLYASPDPMPCQEIATLTLGGVDIRQVHIATLRSLIGYVPQQPKLFTDTIRANITYGLDPYSRLNSLKNVEAAATAAGISDFIRSLPEGYSTLVGDGGLTLSGGQAQRIVIARALVRHPRILVLDEATSNLDAESAEIIRKSVKKLLASQQGLTVLVVTHSRDMMEMADNVVVVDRGAVVEQGPYATLLRRAHGRLREMLLDSD